MAKESYVAALDIGSSRITLAVAKPSGVGMGIVTYCGSVPSQGVEGGLISNRGDVVRCVRDLLDRMQSHLGFAIETLHLAYSAGGRIACRLTRVETECNLRESNDSRSTIIASQDIAALDQNCEKTCGVSELLIDREALIYYADGKPIRSSLEGTYASRFACDYNLFFVQREAHDRLHRLLQQLPIQVLSMPLGIRGSVWAISTPEQRRQGIAVLDVGVERSQLAVYYDDQLQHYAWIGLGGGGITHDIVSEHRLDYGAAEHSKIHEAKDLLGAAEALQADAADAPVTVGLLVCACIGELAETVEAQLEAWGVLHRLETNGLVLTGGGLSFADVGSVFSKFLVLAPQLKVRIGQPPLEAIHSVTSDRLSTSDLMRLLPVLGVVQEELPNLWSSVAAAPAEAAESEGEEPEADVTEVAEATEGPLRKGWRIMRTAMNNLMSDTE